MNYKTRTVVIPNLIGNFNALAVLFSRIAKWQDNWLKDKTRTVVIPNLIGNLNALAIPFSRIAKC
ncbi:hypothetical protein H7U22_12705 [Pedobacter sp. CCM 8938]|uniref:Uncharacterized protein n=1 Tax=Pedobacter fastidiosus TaxID=2765361 RepID=A0ABR7KTA9_9SPHI|nr:hypothetical protein [Pedobacter fastidiosus]MBC6111280.1 hypothetical protein [Pedobacter fastidiosus]